MNFLTNSLPNDVFKNLYLNGRNGAITGTVIGLSKATADVLIEMLQNFQNDEDNNIELSLLENVNTVIKAATVFCAIGLIVGATTNIFKKTNQEENRIIRDYS